MAKITEVNLSYPEAAVKNLFVQDDKKKNYYLITVKGDKRIYLKEFKQKNNTRSLSFAGENDLMNIMKLPTGLVTPLGILNDTKCKVQFYLDKDFLDVYPKLIGVHPNDNMVTVWLKTEDLINIIKEHGNTIQLIEI